MLSPTSHIYTAHHWYVSSLNSLISGIDGGRLCSALRRQQYKHSSRPPARQPASPPPTHSPVYADVARPNSEFIWQNIGWPMNLTCILCHVVNIHQLKCSPQPRREVRAVKPRAHCNMTCHPPRYGPNHSLTDTVPARAHSSTCSVNR